MTWSNALLKSAAEALCSRMDDANTWDTPLPACTGEAHAWEVRTNWEVTWQFPVRLTTTYPAAVVCSICGRGMGIS